MKVETATHGYKKRELSNPKTSKNGVFQNDLLSNLKKHQRYVEFKK